MNTSECYDTVAFIPVRGGSKSIPLKNIKNFCGRPLVYWTIEAAVNCECIDKVFVSTDSNQIRDVVLSFGFSKVEVVERGTDTATDTATTESAMLDFSARVRFKNIVLIQATSPLLTSEDLTNGLSIYHLPDVDSVLSAVPQKRFIWQKISDDIAKPQNYIPIQRPRRQEFSAYYVENGAFYITSRELLLSSQCRISGNIAISPMPEKTYFEIDEPSDWDILETLKIYNSRAKVKDFSKVNLFITDIDGVLTDGGMYYSSDGIECKKFNTRDGMGLAELKKAGIKIMFLTGEKNLIIDKRANKLNVDYVFQGIKDKKKCLDEFFCKHTQFDYSNSVYIGDDINDIDVLQNVYISATPADAHQTVKEIADYVCAKSGGHGCVREFCDIILSARK